MESFSTVFNRHPRLLVIDTASALVQVGVITKTGLDFVWSESDLDSSEGVFACLAQLGSDVRTLPAIVYCEGPGSLLGVRTVASILRTWHVLEPREFFCYKSLELLAWSRRERSCGIIADARKDTWHLVATDERGSPHRLTLARMNELPSQLRMPEHFKSWASVPPGTIRIPYRLADAIPAALDAPILKPTDQPDAYVQAPVDYVRWSASIHRAPT